MGYKMKINNIGIIGHGFVGKAVNQFNAVYDTNIYDLHNPIYNSDKHKENAYNSDIVFINVPTDLQDNRLDTTIVENCIRTYSEIGNKNNIIVIKSTIPVGTCSELSKKYDLNNIVFNPEFLTQRTALADFINEKELYLAGDKKYTQNVKKAYEKFFNFHNNLDVEIIETPIWEEVELLKLARNTFYSMKVGYCNHLYNLCEKLNISYEKFRLHFSRGEWVGAQHTMVPGPDGKLGYGGKCLPKDSIELLNYFKKQDIMFEMLEKSIDFNKKQRR